MTNIGPLTQAEIDQVQRLLSDPLSFPPAFKQWVTGWIEANPPTLPVSQLNGFSAFTARVSTVKSPGLITSGAGTKASSSNASRITHVAAGTYLAIFGAAQVTFPGGAGKQAIMNLAVTTNNGAGSTTAPVGTSCRWYSPTGSAFNAAGSALSFASVTIPNDNSLVEGWFLVDDTVSGAVFSAAIIALLKISN